MPGAEENEWPVIGPLGFTRPVPDIASGVFLVTKTPRPYEYWFPYPPGIETPEWVIVAPSNGVLHGWSPPLRIDWRYHELGRFQLIWPDPVIDMNPADMIDELLWSYLTKAASTFCPDTMEQFRDFCQAWILLETTARYHELWVQTNSYGPWALRRIFGAFCGWDEEAAYELFSFTQDPWPDSSTTEADGEGFEENNREMWAEITQEAEGTMRRINQVGFPTAYR